MYKRSLKHPITALLIAILACGFAMVMNTQMMLGEKVQEIEDGFFTSTPGERSIYSRLSEKLDASNGLWTILESEDAAAAEELSVSRSALLTAYESRDIAAMYDANAELDKAFASAKAAAEAAELDESQASALSSYVTNYEGASKMIEQSSYNSSVLEFMRSVYNKFPASRLADFAGVEPAVSFE
ncbi:MAG TPA: hypothetical protein IAD36_07990 [Candidatus Scatomorpha intestinigallinarum]|uniref:Uncharacterized protein n=1 Tax=Candidatus Scatomorpha intestinigallinarum TaxID=2840923 RepID=A0A9D1DMH1_9FIRM|nr:hypothetical protein [Candidatus Scatomorpha intestinigallinarum]